MKKCVAILFLSFAMAAVLIGCTTLATGGGAGFLPPEANDPALAAGFSREEISAARSVHQAKCARCHRFYDPRDYNEPEWAVWMTKMSKKAKLSPEQEQLLSRYLKIVRSPTR